MQSPWAYLASFISANPIQMGSLIESTAETVEYYPTKNNLSNLPDIIPNEKFPELKSSLRKRPDLLKCQSTPNFMSVEVDWVEKGEDSPKLIKRVGSVRGRKNAVRDTIGQLNIQKTWTVSNHMRGC